MRLAEPVAMLAAFCMLGFAAAQNPQCDVRAYGAKGDGITKDTPAIQHAIDVCSASKGTVVLRAGKFRSGPLQLKSGITFMVASGAMLLGSTDRSDYKPATLMRQPTVEPLLYIANADHVTINGGGVIDGEGKVWWDYVLGTKNAGILGNDHPRPMGLLIDHSNHITVENITIQNSGFWQVVPYYSQYVTLRNLRVLAPAHGAPNTDGIDPFSSSHIVIDHYYASVGDDDIAIKSGAIDSPGPDAPSTDITITDCTFDQGHGLSIGSELSGGVQRIRVERVRLSNTGAGIRLKSNRDRGGDISDMIFKDIIMENVKTSILISGFYPKELTTGEIPAAPVGRLTPRFHDIHFENIRSTNGGAAGVIMGLPEALVEGVTLKNVSIQSKTGMTFGYAKVALDSVMVEAVDGKPMVVAPTAEVSGR